MERPTFDPGGITYVDSDSPVLPRRWSPYDIEIMLHHHCSPTPFDHRDAPIYPERLKVLVDFELLEYDVNDVVRSTPLGAAFIEMLCSTPLPELRYVDPRTV